MTGTAGGSHHQCCRLVDALPLAAEWRKKGMWLDEESVVGDPLFVDVARNDFRLKAASPAHALGFTAFDTSEAGPRGST